MHERGTMQKISFLGGELVLMRDGEQEGDAIGMAKKMQALAKAVGTVKKDGRNTHFNYAFVSYEALAATVREALQDVGLAFFVSTTDDVLDGEMTTLHGSLSFMDSETGAILSVPWVGQGKDGQDKGASKALTSGLKYALMRLLLASERDEVDSDKDGPTQSAQQQRSNAPQAERNPPPTPPTRQRAPQHQGNAVRSPESVRSSLQLRIASQIKAGKWAGSVADGKLVGAVAGRMAEVFAGDPDDSIDIEAHQVVKFLFGKTSLKDLTDAEGRAILGWTARKEGDEWILPDESRKEARNIVASLDAEGQEQLF